MTSRPTELDVLIIVIICITILVALIIIGVVITEWYNIRKTKESEMRKYQMDHDEQAKWKEHFRKLDLMDKEYKIWKQTFQCKADSKTKFEAENAKSDADEKEKQ